MAAEIVAQLRGAAAEREAAYARLLQLEAEHFNANGGSSGTVAEIAVACASPLCEVLCKAASEVDTMEYHGSASAGCDSSASASASAGRSVGRAARRFLQLLRVSDGRPGARALRPRRGARQVRAAVRQHAGLQRHELWRWLRPPAPRLRPTTEALTAPSLHFAGISGYYCNATDPLRSGSCAGAPPMPPAPPGPAAASLRSVFADHMVLQRDTPAQIVGQVTDVGTDVDGLAVTVELDGKVVGRGVTTAYGSFAVTIAAQVHTQSSTTHFPAPSLSDCLCF